MSGRTFRSVSSFYPDQTSNNQGKIKMNEKKRCAWCANDPLYVKYHDEEWGKYAADERRLFEFIVLEGAQAGLSWLTILRKREAYRRCFFGFCPEKVAAMREEDVERLMREGSGIVRNRLKIKSAISNARLFLAVEEEFGSFDRYVKTFLPFGRIIDNRPATLSDIPVSSPVSDAMSGDMRRRGFKFFGTTICYSFLQATGYINDHLSACAFR